MQFQSSFFTRPRPLLACVAPLAALLLGSCAYVEANLPQAAPDPAACVYQPRPDAPVGSHFKPPAGPAPGAPQQVVFDTSVGQLKLQLDPKKAPCAVHNLVSLAEQGYFDASQCHRLTTSGLYVLQCGDPTGTGAGGPGWTFADEYPVGQSNSRELYTAGTVAMANGGKDTNGSQFFLVYEDSPLAPKYTIMGKLDAASLNIVRNVAAQGTTSGGGDGQPAQPVVINSVSVNPEA